MRAGEQRHRARRRREWPRHCLRLGRPVARNPSQGSQFGPLRGLYALGSQALFDLAHIRGLRLAAGSTLT